MMPNFLKMLETLTDLTDFFMENEELGSCVRDREWSEKRDSNPRLSQCFKAIEEFSVHIGVHLCRANRLMEVF